MIQVQPDPVDPAALLADFCKGRQDVGGVVSFTGLVRTDGDVKSLELEHYPDFTEAVIAKQMETIRLRFELLDAIVVHRVGPMVPGEVVVFVATAAAHRRAAFQAADALMDFLKTAAPFWKREHTATGSRWIEPRDQDYLDADRWQP